MGKSLAFFYNYFAFAETLPPDRRLAFYDAVMRYAFRGETPAADSEVFAVFMLVKPSLDKSLAMGEIGRRGGSARSEAKAAAVRENGRLGGRPAKPVTKAAGVAGNQTRTKRKPNGNLSGETKREPNENQTNKNENKNENLNAFAIANARNARAREAEPETTPNVAPETPPAVPVADAPTLDDILRVCRNDDCANPGGKAIPAAFGRYFHAMMEGMGWQQTNGRRVTRRNFRPFLFTWWRKSTADEWADYADGGADAAPCAEAAELAERARRDAEEAARMRERLTGGKGGAK